MLYIPDDKNSRCKICCSIPIEDSNIKLYEKDLLDSEKSLVTLTSSFKIIGEDILDQIDVTHKNVAHCKNVYKSPEIKEPNFSTFLEGFLCKDIKQSEEFIDDFSIKLSFPEDLWALSEGSATTGLPYRNLAGTCLNDIYYIEEEEWIEFKENLRLSIKTMTDFLSHSEIEKNKTLHKICGKIFVNLAEISSEAGTLGSPEEASEKAFSSLKLDISLICQLRKELLKTERSRLLEFLGHLANLTLTGEVANESPEQSNSISSIFNSIISCFTGGGRSQKLTQGLEKLRDFINQRSPRQKKVMDVGQFGVAEYIYGYCLKSFFNIESLDEAKKHIAFMTNKIQSGEELIELAAPRNVGYHFVCDILTDKGYATLNSMGTRKDLVHDFTAERCEEAQVFLKVSESFYETCQPLVLENINVPEQKENNCYLAAGWLKFCVFLHFFMQK